MPTEKEFLAKKALLDTKQDKLIAGTNIQIDPVTNRISATNDAEITDVQVNSQSVVGVDKIARVNVDTIEPNPISTPTDTLTSVDINGIVYELQGGGGNADYIELTQAEYNALTPAEKNNGKMYFITDGESGPSNIVTNVIVNGVSVVTNKIASFSVPEIEANPSGTATDTLNTVDIDGTIYEIQGGGGSGNVDDVYVNGESVLDSNNIAQITSYKTLTQAEYDALPQSKLTDGVLYCIEDSGIIEGNQFAPVIYSLEEREVGVWIDGKPLYQKSFTGTLTSTLTLFSITNLDIDELIKWEVMVNSSFDNNPFKAYLSTNVDSDKVNTTFYNGDMRIHTSSFWVGSGYFATIFYTKTTDTAGSGDWTPSGVPAHHYSTNEQVVGTWIDGSTVYEKIYEFNTPVQISMEAWTDVNDYIPNIGFGKIIEAKGIDANGTLQGSLLCGKNASNHIQLQSPRNGSANIAVSYIIIQYIKTT